MFSWTWLTSPSRHQRYLTGMFSHQKRHLCVTSVRNLGLCPEHGFYFSCTSSTWFLPTEESRTEKTFIRPSQSTSRQQLIPTTPALGRRVWPPSFYRLGPGGTWWRSLKDFLQAAPPWWSWDRVGGRPTSEVGERQREWVEARPLSLGHLPLPRTSRSPAHTVAVSGMGAGGLKKILKESRNQRQGEE